MNNRPVSQFLICILLIWMVGIAITTVHVTSAYTPQNGDQFKYAEVENLVNGTGSYTGYTETTTVHGVETMGATTNGIVDATYSYLYDWSNNQQSATAGAQSGSFTWSPSTFLYVSGTDDQQGYVNPTVWFAMNPSIPVGGQFFLLNTQMTVLSTNYTLYLPTEQESVQTIQTTGSGAYLGSPDNNAYGLFNSNYVWTAYFDPITGYIVGYNYIEHDISPNGNGTGFTYTDNLYVAQTTYQLVLTANPPPPPTSSSTSVITFTSIASTTSSSPPSVSTNELVFLFMVVVIFVIIGVIMASASRRKNKETLPQHSDRPYSPPNIHLTQPPVQQVIIKQTVKVNCKFCGTLIDSTAENCPHCGAPRN